MKPLSEYKIIIQYATIGGVDITFGADTISEFAAKGLFFFAIKVLVAYLVADITLDDMSLVRSLFDLHYAIPGIVSMTIVSYIFDYFSIFGIYFVLVPAFIEIILHLWLVA